MVTRTQVQDAIDAGGGILRLEPCWVPRSFMHPGRRLRLHPDDLYALGGHRGGINERWFSSTTNADNGPGTPADEGLSYVRLDGRRPLPAEGRRREAGDLLLGADGDGSARRAGTCSASSSTTWGRSRTTCTRAMRRRSCSAGKGKPEAYYFPPQYNQTDNNFPYTFMGLEPGTTKADVRRCLENWNKGDNGILVPVARVPAQARHRLADRSRHPARARLARDLRAAGRTATCSRMFQSRGRRPHRRRGRCW